MRLLLMCEVIPLTVGLLLGTPGAWTPAASAEVLDDPWQIVSTRSRGGVEMSVYVEAQKKPGRPAFRIETSLEASPPAAAATLMEAMLESKEAMAGERRRLIERTDREALVHTYVDLPLMFSDREVAIRVRHTDDLATGTHRIDWVDENEALPPVGDGVLRLATEGYWEFRPSGGRSSATYVTRAEVGGSLPDALSDRLMRTQAVDTVKRLQRLLEERGRTHVAGPPPRALATSEHDNE